VTNSRVSRRYLPASTLVLGIVLLAAAARAQGSSDGTAASGQIWANVTFDWRPNEHVTYSLDFEPKIQVSGPPPAWAALDVTPGAQFTLTKWADLIGEGVVARTVQTDNLRTTELTVRGGALFHLFSRQEQLFFKEHLPKRRLVIRDLVRWEWRHFSYSDDEPNSSSGRFRNRVEFFYPLNRPNMGSDGTVHLIADWEWYVPIKGDLSERFANKRRYRGGVGYRRDRSWQMAALYMRSNSRNTIDEPFGTSENIIDLQVKRVW